MNEAHFGRLEPVDLRTGWPDESAAFTPWLGRPENLKLLGRELGLDLELQEREMSVGRYWADLVCRNTETDGYVVVENQLEQSNHKHLGQILTYVAGLSGSGHDIEAAVWICREITDDHRAALDWLNENAGDACKFFAVKIELWRIGDSKVAPRFHVVARPNEWSQGVREAIESASREPTDLKLRQLAYWRGFAELVRASPEAGLRAPKPRTGTAVSFAIGTSGSWLAALASDYDLELQEHGKEQLRAMFNVNRADWYEALEARRAEIETAFGAPLTWYNASGVKTSRIYARRDASLANEEDWPEQHAWLLQNLRRLRDAIVPHLMEIRAGSGEG